MPIAKLGQQMQLALELDLPAELVAFVVTTSNAKRLQTLFQEASQRLLAAHQDVRQRPGSALAFHERVRHKALLDLVRARMAIAGCRKPAIPRLLQLMRRPLDNVVDLRRAA